MLRLVLLWCLLVSYGANEEERLIGSIVSNILSKDDEHVYILSPKNIKCDKFLFAFKEFDITGSAQLQMYDRSVSTPFFTCVACGNIVPPFFYSSSGDVLIRINGVSGAGFSPSSFQLQYVGQISQPNQTEIKSIHTNFELDLHMPYGHIRPVLIGGKYVAPYSRQSWSISVDAPFIKFYVAFINFGFTVSGPCRARLVIYDGLNTSSNVLFSGCSSIDKPDHFFYSSSGNALVVLEGMSGMAEADFLLDYLGDADLYHCGSASTPDVLQSNSMTIVDGSKSSHLMRRGESCEWLIQPLGNGPVTLLMSWVSLKPGATVVVYDNDEESGVVLWDSSGTFTTVPPPLTSSQNSLYVKYSGNSLLATSFFGFSGDYYSRCEECSGTGSSQELYSMSSALGIRLPDLVSGKYKAQFSYSYLVKPLSSTGSLYIFINQINISDSNDKIKVYAGPTNSSALIRTLSGSMVPKEWIEIPSGVALLEFQSDSDQQRTGKFDFSFFSDGPNYHCGFPTNPGVLTASSMMFTDGSSSTESLYDDQYCEWIVEPFNSKGVVLYFERMDLRGGGFLKVYDGIDSLAPLLVDIANVEAIPVLTFSKHSNKMKIVYSSTSTELPKGLGFSATYFTINEYVTGPGSDNIIKLYGASSNSFGLPIPVNDSYALATNYTFLIDPIGVNGPLFVQFLNVSISSCFDSIKLLRSDWTAIVEFDCNERNDSSNFIGHWIPIPNGSALLQFNSSSVNEPNTQSSFDIAYYSDGPSHHCGHSQNPGLLKASSMPFSDGSGLGKKMHTNIVCEWIIHSPYISDISNYVIEFSSNDLRGGAKLFVFDGTDDKSDLLWSCDNCTEIPAALVTTADVAYVRFISPPQDLSRTIGEGFRANYWAIFHSDTVNANTREILPNTRLMGNPRGFSFKSNALPNVSSGWVLGISNELSSVSTSSSYSADEVLPYKSFHDSSTYLSHPGKGSFENIDICGFVQSNQETILKTSHFSAKANQYVQAYLDSSEHSRRVLHLKEEADGDDPVANSSVVASQSCVYIIDTGMFKQSASLRIEGLGRAFDGRLRVFGGEHGYDAELLDMVGGANKVFNFFLPCGQGTVMLDRSPSSSLQYDFQMYYSLVGGDNGTNCAKYVKALYSGEEEESFFVRYASAIILLSLLLFSLCFCMACPDKIPMSWKDFATRNIRSVKRRYRVATAPRPHPRYTGKWDAFRNKYLLRSGECCICQLKTEKVICLSGCNHSLCLEDLNGYICAALGDISMFPLKCPMHFDNCISTISPVDAKRVLLESQYEKFLEFTDRGFHGEGMRCIFCSNYVKFPLKTKNDMMRCPKCIQVFCIRCKGPWHYGVRCVVESIDDELETWKNKSGAQKCPGCSKLIEKDDPSTCHHMIHKFSDGIPCCRERTDFCYLCGVEVLPDYPHNEVKNPGINHFPEGVFQRCRTIIIKDRDIEREFLRKAKRRQNARSNCRVQPISFEDSSVGYLDDGTVELASESPVISNDPFEVLWSDSPVRSRLEAEFSEYA